MQAAILIGGRGTRLGTAVADTPKPLLEVAGRPFVEHLLINLKRFGFTDFLLLAGYKAAVVEQRYGAESAFARELDANLRVLVEPEPLGTAGALKFARAHLADEFLLLNGDSIFDFNYLDLCCCEVPAEPGDWLARVALLPVESADRYGFVELRGTVISAFREKPATPQDGLINSGVYWLKAELVDSVEATPCSLEQAIFPELVRQGRLVGRTYRGYFIDIGIPEDLARARTELRARLQRPAAFLDRDGTLNHDDGYTHTVEGFRWVDGAMAAIKLLNDAGYLVFMVTNQAGIARGYYGHEDVQALHDWMQLQLRGLGAHIDDIRYCPHHPDGSVTELAVTCTCRKPATGMLDSLIDQWQPDLAASFMLGDAEKDAEAGRAAGMRGETVATGEILRRVTAILEEQSS
ncbi:MAG: HAD-IIIA family hydrolase [Halioglobus sp.]|nr:HAD-IIIA family hydrolase [Halioglobus sp.]